MLNNLGELELKKRSHKGEKKRSVWVKNRKAIFKVGLCVPNLENEKVEDEDGDEKVDEIARLKRDRSSSSSGRGIGSWRG